ncbi:MAG: hypothetical protein J0L70_29440 [Leptolyngbya sp. UWPOB_LEPTO1]|uniref:slr1601 family putative cell division protein n=1 Tax=Leptolyngbya sp. UWPOB_LEPTO1 TaxID=2815653 RepID=UPI001AC8DC2F|nr:hypothetical protein [Leptolyngbya sp. UWPOB_LEPTO1]MBN8564658.1 hypothetical protein [Leptolyngbya sp. UWPOB_LEPTO1]
MNALPLPQPPESQKPRRSRAQQPLRRQVRSRVLAAEALIKLSVNALISTAAIAALTQLIPYGVTQQAKLKEIQTEVKTADTRVSRLKAAFNRNFDPHQASKVAQEQANVMPPDSRMVVLGDVEPPAQTAQATPAQNP